MSVYLAWHFLYLFLRPRRAERVGRHRTGVSALTLVTGYVAERNAQRAAEDAELEMPARPAEPMPTRQPAQHRYSRLWD